MHNGFFFAGYSSWDWKHLERNFLLWCGLFYSIPAFGFTSRAERAVAGMQREEEEDPGVDLAGLVRKRES